MAVSVDMSTPHHFSTNPIWTGEFLRVIENEAKPKFSPFCVKAEGRKFLYLSGILRLVRRNR